MFMLRLISVALIALALGACTAVRTQAYSDSAEDSWLDHGTAEGILYFLPKRRLEITYERKTATQAEIKEKVALAKKASTQKQASVVKAKAALDKARDQQASLREDSIDEAKEANKKTVADATKALVTAKLAANAAKEALEVLEQAVELGTPLPGQPATCPLVELQSFTVRELPMEPDPSMPLRAQMRPSPLRDDALTVEVNERGLLSSAASETTDQTATIITDLLSAIIVPSPGPAPGIFSTFSETKRIDPTDAAADCPPPGKPVFSKLLVDPAEWSDPANFASALGAPDLDYELHVKALIDSSTVASPPRLNFNDGMGFKTTLAQANLAGDRDAREVSGLLYRSPVPYEVSIRRKAEPPATSGSTAYAGVHVIPNGGPIGMVPISAGVFTTSKTDLMFKDGLLVKYDASRPSEVAQIVRIPLGVFDSVVSSIGKLIPFTESSANVEKIYAEIAQIEAGIAESASSGAASDAAAATP